jgi:phosphatidylserine decarboxylase
VLESRVIQGRAYLDVTAEDSEDGSSGRTLSAVEGMGYQFLQTRGLVVLDSAIGLVACLPVGMAQVGSVVLTAEVGVELHKGEELGYFQFGGSDFIMVFEDQSQVHIGAAKEQHFLQGEAFASAVTS